MIWAFQPFAAVIALVLGVIVCFAGYRLFRVVLVVAGFLAGAVIAGGLFYTFVQPSDILALVAGLIGGVLGAILLGFFYFLGIFLLGAGLGGLIGTVAAANFGWERLVSMIIAAVVCGVLALALQRLLIIVATAFLGGWVILGAVAVFTHVAVAWEFLRHPPAYWQSPWATFYLIAWILLGGLGVAVQYRSRPPDRKTFERRSSEKD